MREVALGTTGMRVTPLIYGTLPLGPLQAGLSPAEGGRLIRHALELGVNMLDTAELYETYPHIRAGIEVRLLYRASTEGVKIDLGDEWVLILPDPDGPFFHIIAEGSSDEQARVLTDKYAGLVTGLQ